MKKLVLSCVLALAVLVPAKPAFASSNPLLGEIMWVGFNFCPRGWSEANGQLLPISSNQALFSLYGTIYGGDGRTTFALPDLRGRMPMHAGQGPGLTDRRQGQRAGAESVTLTAAQMPSHNHGLSSASGTLHASKLAGETPSADGAMLADGQRAAVYAPAPASAADVVDMAAESVSVSGSTDSTGGNQTHPNMPPYVVLKACVAIQGIFPSRS